MNRLLRRVDWRFLVPSASGPTEVRHDGGRVLAAALQTFAPSVAELREPASGGADIAIGNGRSDLLALRRSLRAGGTCLVEWRAPGGKEGSLVRRRLAGAGLDNVEAYWAWPPASGLPRFWLPLGSPEAAAYLLEARPALEAPFERAKRTVRDRAWSVAARAGLLAPLYVLGRNGPEVEAGGLQTLMPESRALRWLLVTQGGRSINKVLALPFAPSESKPLALVKIARVVESDPMLEREAAVLREVHRLAPELVEAPSVLGVTRVAGRAAIAETFLSGDPLWTRLRRDTIPDLAAAAVDWASRLVPPGPSRPRREWWDTLVAAPLTAFRERYASVAEPYDLAATEQRLRDLPDLPRAIEHRDFSPWNIGLRSNGKLVVHDWESAEPWGLPAADLVYFFTYAAFFLSGALESGRIEETYTAAFDERSDLGGVVARSFAAYFGRTDVERAALPPLRLLTWIVHAVGEHERLGRDDGAAPTPESLRRGVFFRLWQAELRRGPAV